MHAELGNATLGAHLPQLLGSGISTWGNSRRIEAKLMQAAAGQQLSVYFVGGSITRCHRVYDENCWLAVGTFNQISRFSLGLLQCAPAAPMHH